MLFSDTKCTEDCNKKPNNDSNQTLFIEQSIKRAKLSRSNLLVSVSIDSDNSCDWLRYIANIRLSPSDWLESFFTILTNNYTSFARLIKTYSKGINALVSK